MEGDTEQGTFKFQTENNSCQMKATQSRALGLDRGSWKELGFPRGHSCCVTLDRHVSFLSLGSQTFVRLVCGPHASKCLPQP